MINERTKEIINRATGNAYSLKEWRNAAQRMYSAFGKEAIYFFNCERFIVDNDDYPCAIPYTGEHEIGFHVEHTYLMEYEDESNQYFSYKDEYFKLA